MCLPTAHLLHNVCFLLNYSSPAVGPALHTEYCWGGGQRTFYINLYLYWWGNSTAKKGSYYLEPITIIICANPTIVQVFLNRGSFSPLQLLTPKMLTSGSVICYFFNSHLLFNLSFDCSILMEHKLKYQIHSMMIQVDLSSLSNTFRHN